ncbi:HK97 family phage prohead protease [Rickettsia endosymbiont of Cardiosporidium cionae]|uniref:HK97 family phage prohead protease n=1 Tax=Rickettsia endosymbiont of Cardiosporidium cionae TaxID=2777155 RepID=UPI001894261A|nr:HK97 family phage prohead protease [Rickettsia endosymbiont of Cardiosporidium cionae]KAF8818807.1 HK97 family phage prohead protease [Rickettsia endosymbiont of Cardiosporidium cionae]
MKKGKISSRYTIKSSRKNGTRIFGYASVFNVIDQHNDIIFRGAFQDSIAHKVKLLWQHDHLKPIGTIYELVEDDFGLKIEANITNQTQTGIEAISLVKQKAVNGLSIGFNVKSRHRDNKGNIIITKADLLEVSIVTFPANQYASINCIKNLQNDNSVNRIDYTENSYKKSLIKMYSLFNKLK